MILCVVVLSRLKPRALKCLLQISHSTRPLLTTDTSLFSSLLTAISATLSISLFDIDGTVLRRFAALDSSSVSFSYSASSLVSSSLVVLSDSSVSSNSSTYFLFGPKL